MESRPASKSGRRPAGYWDPFNNWWHNFDEKAGSKPSFDDLSKWYQENAAATWADLGRPSLEDTILHSRRLRSKYDGRTYQKEHRRSKRLEGSTQDTSDVVPSTVQLISGAGVDGTRRRVRALRHPTSSDPTRQEQHPRDAAATADTPIAANNNMRAHSANSDEDVMSCQSDDMPIACLIRRKCGGDASSNACRPQLPDGQANAAKPPTATQSDAKPTPQVTSPSPQALGVQQCVLPQLRPRCATDASDKPDAHCAANKASGAGGSAPTLSLDVPTGGLPALCVTASSHTIEYGGGRSIIATAVSDRRPLLACRVSAPAATTEAPGAGAPGVPIQSSDITAGNTLKTSSEGSDEMENVPQLHRRNLSVGSGSNGTCNKTTSQGQSDGSVLGVIPAAGPQYLRQCGPQMPPYAFHEAKDKLPTSLPPRPPRRITSSRNAQPQPLRELNDCGGQGAMKGVSLPLLPPATQFEQPKQVSPHPDVKRTMGLSAAANSQGGSMLAAPNPAKAQQMAVCGAGGSSNGGRVGLDLSHNSSPSDLLFRLRNTSGAQVFAPAMDVSSGWGAQWLAGANQRNNAVRAASTSSEAGSNSSSNGTLGHRGTSVSSGSSRSLSSWTQGVAPMQQEYYGTYVDHQYLAYAHGVDWYGTGIPGYPGYGLQQPFYNTASAAEHPPGAWNMAAAYYYPAEVPPAAGPFSSGLPQSSLYQMSQHYGMQYWSNQELAMTPAADATDYGCQHGPGISHGLEPPVGSYAASTAEIAPPTARAPLWRELVSATAADVSPNGCSNLPHQEYEAFQDDELDLLYQLHMSSQDPVVPGPDPTLVDPDLAWAIDDAMGPVQRATADASLDQAGWAGPDGRWLESQPVSAPGADGRATAPATTWKVALEEPLQDIPPDFDEFLLQDHLFSSAQL